ncbi:MAG TPA: peptide ABC transporter substrate-binding protein [Chloroflexota bacterium]|nr:peptide ABC transporter substrate-binding protein [Chloroflexota bacterium]
MSRPRVRSAWPGLRIRAAAALCASFLLVGGAACNGPIPLDVMLDRGATLRVHGAPPTSLDPALVSDSVSWSYLIQIFSGLVRLDERLEIVPDLAERWELSPDGRTYTFTVRADAKFHSGRAVTADDFKYALERALNPATHSTTAHSYLGDIVGAADLLAGRATDLRGVRAPDPRTLEIEIDAPKSYFLAKLTHPISFALDRANVESGQSWFERPNGAGPFRLAAWERDTKISLLRFNGYWAGPARVRAVEFDLSPVPGVVLYERGDVDVTEVDLGDLDRVGDPKNPLSRELVVTPLLSTWYVGMNARMPPFDDPFVRRAFALATDRPRLTRVFFRDTRTAATTILPPGLPGHNPDVRAPAFDVPRARQVLAQSRYAGRMPEIVLAVGAGSASTGEAMAEMYARNLGVDVGVREWGEDFLPMLERREAQMFLTGWIADYPHPENFLDILFHSRSNANYGASADPALDQVLEAARVERDEGRRADLYAQAERAILDQAAAIPIHHEVARALVRPYVRGLVWTPLGVLSYHNVEVGERTVERRAA